jgi:hypothetical protein
MPKIAVAVPLSSPAAAQRCAEGAGLDSGGLDSGGLDSGAAAAAQSAMPSIAPLPPAPAADHLFHWRRRPLWPPQLYSRISTSLTDVTKASPAELEAALRGRVTRQHRFRLGLHLQQIDAPRPSPGQG